MSEEVRDQDLEILTKHEAETTYVKKAPKPGFGLGLASLITGILSTSYKVTAWLVELEVKLMEQGYKEKYGSRFLYLDTTYVDIFNQVSKACGIVFGVVSLILGTIGIILFATSKKPNKKPVGLILSIIGMVLALIALII